MTRLLLAVALAFVANPVLPDNGSAIYLGRQVALESAGATRKLARFPCHSCHGRDAQGGIEGDVPPIDWASLSEATRDRPAFATESFHRAVTEGVSPDGREMSRLMPRFDLSRIETDALAAYLRQIKTLQRRGVAPDRITVGVASLGDAATTDAYVDALRAILHMRLGGDLVHGRRVELVVVGPGDADAYARLLVLLAASTKEIDQAVSRDLPILAPIGPLDGDEDRTIVRAITPSRERLFEALAEDVAGAKGSGSIAILSSDEAMASEMAVALRFAAPSLAGRLDQEADPAEVVLLGGTPLSPGMTPQRIWVDQQSARQMGELPADAEIRIVLDAPEIAVRAAERGRSPVLVHAEIAAAVLAEALKVAGRDLTRASLFKAIDDAMLLDIGLDYRKSPLTGTIRAPVISLR